ncbi:MAG: dihydrolipoyl dehydrogenase [Holosporales bacterium]|jgi:dihydrolipoamide dehydrogenase|nr:dihydrolipoyl dehydrogenase [Holosporales bacterium]
MFDIAIIGSGPGGYVCALRAAQLGLKVAVLEKEKIGGTCLNIGCIPTKALLQSAKVKHLVERAAEFGIDSRISSISLEKITERSARIISGLNRSVAGLLAKNKITVINGAAKFKDKNTLIVGSEGNSTEVTAKNIVISTGATPRMIPGIEKSLIDDGSVWTSKEAIAPKFLPKKLLIMGSGAIGIELASFYNSLGSDVTISEIQDRILIQEDKEISDSAYKSFIKQGIKILLSTKTQGFKKESNGVSVEFADKDNKLKTETFDAVIVAIGVVPNTAYLALDKAGVKTKQNGAIETFDYQETSQKGIYAIGDVAEPPYLAHKASREGIIVAEKIAGLQDISPINLKAIPACTYSSPQIASIGMTEEQAWNAKNNVKIGKSYFRGNGKALAAGEPDGFVKVIFDGDNGELLGACMIGYEVSELLPIFSVAISAELTEKELLATIFPHPTMSECLQEAVEAAFGVAIHS